MKRVLNTIAFWLLMLITLPVLIPMGLVLGLLEEDINDV